MMLVCFNDRQSTRIHRARLARAEKASENELEVAEALSQLRRAMEEVGHLADGGGPWAISRAKEKKLVMCAANEGGHYLKFYLDN